MTTVLNRAMAIVTYQITNCHDFPVSFCKWGSPGLVTRVPYCSLELSGVCAGTPSQPAYFRSKIYFGRASSDGCILVMKWPAFLLLESWILLHMSAICVKRYFWCYNRLRGMPGVSWSFNLFSELRGNHSLRECRSQECQRGSRFFWGLLLMRVWCIGNLPCSHYFLPQYCAFSSTESTFHHIILSLAHLHCKECPTLFIPFLLV